MSFTYKGLSATLHTRRVTADEAQQQLHRLVQQTPRISVVTDRPTQLGDEVVLDYAGFCDGVQFPGGTAEYQTLTLGSGMFIPGFEEQLIGKNIGEEVTVHVTFPEQYHSEELAGKAAEFHCKLHEIRVKGTYEADDTFAKEVGGCSTLAELQQKLQQSMQNRADEQAQIELQQDLLQLAAKTLDEEPSESEINAAVEEQLQNMNAQLRQQGLSLEIYCQFMNMTMEQLWEQTRPAAVQEAKQKQALARIIALENLQVTEEEMASAYALICEENQMTMEQLQPYLTEDFALTVTQAVLNSKAMHLIRDAASITTEAE